MTIAVILVLVSVFSLWLLLRFAQGHGLVSREPGDLRYVDIEAFHNLVDPGEAEFLRAKLSDSEFRTVQRARLLAAVEYIRSAAANARILMRMGEAARLSPEPSVAEAGEKLVDTAIRLRIYSLQAIAKIYVGIVFPGANFLPGDLTESYERMTGLVLSLRRTQQSGAQTAALP